MLDTDEELEWAWLAGIVEGEGCVGVYALRKSGKPAGHNTIIAVEMKDLDILERIQRITGKGTIRKKPARGNSAETHVWKVYRREDVAFICERILPMMGERRTRKMQEVITHVHGR